MEKENIAVIFGGKSTEHDISIITGIQTYKNVDREKYNVLPIYISRKGEMFIGNNLEKIETYADFNPKDKKIKKVSFCPGSNFLFLARNSNLFSQNFKKQIKIDCAILCCHGINGEDGTLQGLLELCDIPYTSSGVMSSAISMDKIIMKDVFVVNDIKTAKYTYFNKIDYSLNPDEILKNIENSLMYPVFVKPANLGSSIGISKCKDREQLDKAIEIACSYDSRILVEEGIEDNIEANCAVLGNSDYQASSKIEYPKSWSDFLSFDEKYIQRKMSADETKVKKTKSNKKLPDEIESKIKIIAENTFKIFSCSGVVRIDFLIDKNYEIYLNELNSIPGSLAFYLFKDKFDFKNLLNRLIDIAKKEKMKKTAINCLMSRRLWQILASLQN